MGNCLSSKETLTAEILPKDGATVYPAVRLHGTPDSIFSAYIRFAILQNTTTSSDIVSSSRPSLPAPSYETARGLRSNWENSITVPMKSDFESGSRDALLRFIDTRFPDLSATEAPSKAVVSGGESEDGKVSLMVRVTRLQHKSVTWHVEKLVRWAEDLATRGGKKAVDPKMGSWKMEVRKFGRSYSQLLDVMMEHAQMEERVLFPIFDRADRGLTKAAKEEHARDLPIMNGIKEIIKSIEVLDSGSSNYREAMYNLSTRLNSFQEQCKQHFMEEEMELLPLMEAVELSKEQDERALEQCFDVMQATHSGLLKFLVEGLSPNDAMKYLDLISMCRDRERMEYMLRMIIE
ncbi:hemerythrin HHE cation-binding domain protein [Trifolium repens]|nr:hemerythrin HHE cation-binding domain protein [Trifolium repens]